MSRYENTFRTFPDLTAAVGTALACRDAVLDGEIVHLGQNGKPQFLSLMRRRSPQYLCAFDLLWLNGRELRGVPLLERKRLLRNIIPEDGCCPVRYVNYVVARGIDMFNAVCAEDLEGIVAKRVDGLYTPDETSWAKIKNRDYSQNVGRWEWFENA